MYYPKSQITTDLYTNGQELVQGNNIEYVGYYYKTSDERYFSGKNPNDLPSFEIFINEKLEQVEGDAEIGEIGALTNEASFYLYPSNYRKSTKISIPEIAPTKPQNIIVLPTEKNYELGEFQRYFFKRINSIEYVETNNDIFKQYIKKLPNTLFRLYQPFSLPWEISGVRNDVYNVNKKTVERVAKNLNLISFKSYFKNNYTQYYRYKPNENLKTNGTEFLLEQTGRPYIGLYHIHPEKGPMVGAQHTNIPHDYLIPISGSNQQFKVDKIETQKSNKTSGGY